MSKLVTKIKPYTTKKKGPFQGAPGWEITLGPAECGWLNHIEPNEYKGKKQYVVPMKFTAAEMTEIDEVLLGLAAEYIEWYKENGPKEAKGGGTIDPNAEVLVAWNRNKKGQLKYDKHNEDMLVLECHSGKWDANSPQPEYIRTPQCFDANNNKVPAEEALWYAGSKVLCKGLVQFKWNSFADDWRLHISLKAIKCVEPKQAEAKDEGWDEDEPADPETECSPDF